MDSLLQQLEPIKEVTGNSDLGEGELWLFSIPSEIPFQELNGKSLTIAPNSDIPFITSDKIQGEFSTSVRQCSEHHLKPLIPSEEPGELVFGDEFIGQVTIHRSISMTDMEYPVRKKRNYDLQSGLKQRWKPFGWKTSVLCETSSTKKRKSKKVKK